MTITIGRRWPTTSTRGDRQVMCSYCGVQWRRSQLRRDAEGNLVCPDEGDGKSELELSMGNAEKAVGYGERRYGTDGGAMDKDITETTPAQDLANTIGRVTFG